MLLGNKIYQVLLDKSEQLNIRCIYTYEMKLTDSYLGAIDLFTWETSIKNVISRCENDCSTRQLQEMCFQEVDFQFRLMGLSGDNELGWKTAFSSYMTFYINNSEEILSNEVLKKGMKNRCIPCDRGIMYYNGQDTVYLRIEKDYSIE